MRTLLRRLRGARPVGSAPRVAHLVPARFGAGGVIGGAERYALELARHMARQVPTRLITFGEEPADRVERLGELEVRVLGRAHFVRGQRANPVAPGIAGALRGVDVVHCHQQHVLASTLAAALGRACGRTVVVSDLGGGGFDLSGFVSTDRLYHAHLHISDFSRRVFGHVDDPTAHVILGGVDAERFSPAPSRPGTFRALFVGRLLPHKGLDDLLDGVPEDLPLDVVGPESDPGYAARLRERARGKQVRFLGALDDSALIAAYRSASAIVLPSVYRPREGPPTTVPELLGQSLLEGMACGLAGVCTRVASLPEVVEDGVTGLVVPPNDPQALGAALRRLATSPELAVSMGRAGRARATTHFSWARVVARCLAIYARPGGPHP